MEVWMLVGQLLMAVGTIGALIIMAAAFNKKQNVQFKQPVNVTISEELHKIFAAKETFDRHVAENKAEHEQLHSRIGGVDRGNGGKLNMEVTAVHVRINAIDKSVSRLEATTELQNQQLAAIQSDIKQLLQRHQ